MYQVIRWLYQPWDEFRTNRIPQVVFEGPFELAVCAMLTAISNGCDDMEMRAKP